MSVEADHDPRLAALEVRIASHRNALAELEARVPAARSELSAALGGLRAAVGNQSGALRERVAGAESGEAFDRSTAEHELEERMRSQRLARDQAFADTIASAHDHAAALEDHVPTLTREGLSSDDLPSPLTIRTLASLGSIELPALSHWGRDSGDLPALVPLVDSGHVLIEAPGDAPELTAILKNLVGQAFAAAPGGQLVVTVFDPRIRGTLDSFSAHGADRDARVIDTLGYSAEHLEKTLGDHLRLVGHVRATMASQFRSLGELVKRTGQHEHQFRLLVILDAPDYWSERSVGDLKRLVERGAALGVSVIVHRDPALESPRGVDMDAALSASADLSRVVHGPSGWELRPQGDAPPRVLVPHPAPSLAAQRDLMRLVVEASRSGSLPKVPFADLVSSEVSWMLDERGVERSTAEGVEVLLGKQGNQEVSFTLGDTVSNLHNVLVGGRAGSGKTVLLKAMIYSMAARYSPRELRLFLLDFKEGVEFQQFAAAPGGGLALPHADVVGMESDAEFGLAVLEHFRNELRARSSEFKRVGNVQSIAGYRAKTGIVLPRWVLVVDEFQGLFAGPTSSEATVALEDLVRRGRSFGLHVVLASQTLSGIRMDGDKEHAILENVPVRLVLQLGPDESAKFLRPGNDGASQLRYRGQAILNTHAGAADENQQFVVAYGDSEYFDLQARLAAAATEDASRTWAETRVYQGDHSVSGRELLAVSSRPAESDGMLPAWFGQESTVEARVAYAPLAPMSSANVLVLGSQDAPGAIATLQTAVLSAAVAAPDTYVVVFDALAEPIRRRSLIDEWLDTIHGIGCNVLKYGTGDEAEFLAMLRDLAARSQRAVVAVLGAENSDLAREVDADWETLVRELPRKGVHIVGYWSDLRDVPGSQYNVRDDYQTILFVGADEQLIEQASGRSRHDIPALRPGRTIVFSSTSSQRGMHSVAAVRPLDGDDLNAWEASG